MVIAGDLNKIGMNSISHTLNNSGLMSIFNGLATHEKGNEHDEIKLISNASPIKLYQSKASLT